MCFAWRTSDCFVVCFSFLTVSRTNEIQNIVFLAGISIAGILLGNGGQHVKNVSHSRRWRTKVQILSGLPVVMESVWDFLGESSLVEPELQPGSP